MVARRKPAPNPVTIFTNPSQPAAFSSISNVHQTLKKIAKNRPTASKKQVRQALEALESWSVHRPVRYKFQRRKTRGFGRFITFQADLCDMQNLRNENDGYGYLLVCIDVYTRMLYVRPVRNKSGSEVALAMRDIWSNGMGICRLITDAGKEFLNRHVREFLEAEYAEHFVPNSPMKASVVERANRTLKTRLYRFMTHNNTRRYVDKLEQIVTGINKSVNRGIGMRPVDVTSNIFIEETNVRPPKKCRFQVGDYCRIATERGTFSKGYLGRWSREIFIVSEALDGAPPICRLKDRLGEPIEGLWYEEELNKCTDLPDTFKIEKVLSRRRTQTGNEVLVKWLNYGEKFNSWVAEKDLIRI